jgi:serine/threonine protein kinase
MPFSTGQILNNRYRIVKLLGQGGFGAVYRAWDLQLEGVCALKENLDATPEAQRQFEREARLLFGLRHLGLARVSDYFFIPGQGQYLVMEYIEGDDLETRLSQARIGAVQSLSEKEVLPWLIQTCDALTYLHTRTSPVIHRDIKPANIKITPEGQAVLVDFGIAKIFDPHLKTHTGARAATPGYAPPEQFGQGITDAQSDVYALGATAYHLLAGQVPPPAMDITAGLAPPPPPVRTLNPAVSESTSQAIQHAMQLNRAARTPSAAAFKAELGQAAAAPVSTLPSTVTVPQVSGAPYRASPAAPARQPALAPAGGARPALYWLGGGLLALFLILYLLIANASGL